MTSFSFSVSDRIYISGQYISVEILDLLKRRMSNICVNWCPGSCFQDANITLEQVANLETEFPGQARQMDALYGFWVTIRNAKPTLLVFHKGHTIISISFGNNIRIEFQATQRIKLSKLVGKLYCLLLYCIRVSLQSSGHLLIHGAAFSTSLPNHKQRALLILGQRGIRKTMLSLTLMRRGWDYLADDKFILEQRKAVQYQQSILIRDHHFEQLPWLSQVVSNAPEFLKYRQWRKFFRKIAYRIIPKKLLPNEDRLFNSGINCLLSELFPNQLSQQISAPPQVFILKNGERFEIQKISKSEALRDIWLLQRMANAEFNDIDDQLSLSQCQQVITPTIEDLSKHFPEQQYFRFFIPSSMSVDAIYEEIVQCTDCQ